jgi:outer membrane biosynthesis protein TonB
MGFVVDADGRVSRVEALGDSSPDFIAPAKAAIRQWTFEPATRDGRPIPVILVEPLMFTLD